MTDAELMEAIAFEKRHAAEAEKVRGPISYRRYYTARIEPVLAVLTAEKLARMRARKVAR